MTRPVPIALTIAGSDSSGGAGIQADLKTFSALGVYGASVITALTAQNTRGVEGVLGVPPDFIASQLDAVAGDLAIAAVKTGMLGDVEAVRAVADGVARHALTKLVVDPVMVATSGDVLLAPSAIDALRGRLAPLALLLTPNLHEAGRLLSREPAANITEMEQQARDLLALGSRAVLVKGGHAAGEEAVDVLAVRVDAGADIRHYAAARVETGNTHGTGCTLSAAIAAHLARGQPLVAAVGLAKEFLSAALISGSRLAVGRGNGPVDHLFAIRRDAEDET
ncbi:MAG: bifunctional hydroxymethylpyrimidine kinase/phosphomethylpyrimidine kinase [Hyphomicrobiaceae bacterium]|nr:bifunctional hydroxymethylpyrimidine kinase/phosphomethylpyrimidine kinase [Hyphomicrobiaceae bacterium]